MIETFDLALPHGITLSCRASGVPGARRVMLLHGFPEAAFVWDDVMAMLSRQARCIAPNQRGYERSSAYMNFLCRADAEALLSENDYQRLWPFFTRMGEASWLDAGQRAKYREVWRHGLSGALNWYRASPLRPPTSADDAIHRLQLPDDAITVRVPTTVVWGEGDTALLPGLLDGLERWVPRLRLCRVPEASHWIVHEQPQRVAAEVARALRDAAASG